MTSLEISVDFKLLVLDNEPVHDSGFILCICHGWLVVGTHQRGAPTLEALLWMYNCNKHNAHCPAPSAQSVIEDDKTSTMNCVTSTVSISVTTRDL